MTVRGATGIFAALAAGCALGLNGLAAPAAAQDYPARPVRIVVTAGAGAPGDVVARVLAQGLSERYGQQFFIENRPSATGVLAVSALTKSEPDGYTLLLAHSSPLVINQYIFKPKPPYDAGRDLAPIALLANISPFIVTHPNVPAATIAEFVKYAKSQPPGSLNYSSAGQGSMPHLAAEQFTQRTGIKMTHIPYKTAPEGLTAVLTGDSVLFFAPGEAVGFAESGRLKILATTAQRRFYFAPDVPTITEAGLPGFVFGAWFALFAPPGTSVEIIAKLNAGSRSILNAPEVREKLERATIEVSTSTPEELSDHLQKEAARWAEIVKASGIAVE